MAYIMSLLNQKGGIGKTTAAIQIGVGLKRRGYRVLMLDMDPQCNLTFSLGGDYQNSPTIMDAIMKDADITECIQHLDEVDLIPSDNNLSAIETMIEEDGKEFMLVDILNKVKESYDYIIADSPPTLSLLTISIMVATDGIIIPANLDMYSLQGISQLYRTYQAVKNFCNENLHIEGILITRSARTLKRTLHAVADEFKIHVFNTEISNSPMVVNAVIEQKSLYKMAPNAKVTKDYDSFLDELLDCIHAKPVSDGNKSIKEEKTEVKNAEVIENKPNEKEELNDSATETVENVDNIKSIDEIIESHPEVVKDEEKHIEPAKHLDSEEVIRMANAFLNEDKPVEKEEKVYIQPREDYLDCYSDHAKSNDNMAKVKNKKEELEDIFNQL